VKLLVFLESTEKRASTRIQNGFGSRKMVIGFIMKIILYSQRAGSLREMMKRQLFISILTKNGVLRHPWKMGFGMFTTMAL